MFETTVMVPIPVNAVSYDLRAGSHHPLIANADEPTAACATPQNVSGSQYGHPLEDITRFCIEDLARFSSIIHDLDDLVVFEITKVVFKEGNLLNQVFFHITCHVSIGQPHELATQGVVIPQDWNVSGERGLSVSVE
jgi:hypothetical protein